MVWLDLKSRNQFGENRIRGMLEGSALTIVGNIRRKGDLGNGVLFFLSFI